MSKTLDFESDQFLKLLTDALQSGPGTPQWHEAVQKLRASGDKEFDEYRLIVSARENLESGRDYRTVHAGPGFTRKVMAEIEKEGTAKRRALLPTTTIIAILGIVAVVAVVITLAVMNHETASPTTQPIPAELQQAVFTNTILSTDFTGIVPGIPPEWRAIGKEAVKPVNGLRCVPPAKPHDAKEAEYRGGGIILTTPIHPNQPFMVNVTLRLDKSTDNLLAQLFVTDDDIFEDNAQSISPHELVNWIQGGQIKVGGLPNGSVVAAGDRIDDSHDSITAHLVLRMMGKYVIVETSDGKRLYEGKHELADGKPRFVGIRFKVRGNERPDSVVVQSVRIQKP